MRLVPLIAQCHFSTQMHRSFLSQKSVFILTTVQSHHSHDTGFSFYFSLFQKSPAHDQPLLTWSTPLNNQVSTVSGSNAHRQHGLCQLFTWLKSHKQSQCQHRQMLSTTEPAVAWLSPSSGPAQFNQIGPQACVGQPHTSVCWPAQQHSP